MHHPLKPIPLWQSILMFGIPALLGIFGMYWLLPTLDAAGVPMIWNYVISMAGMFPLLLCLSLISLRIEQGTINWNIIKERFRIKPMSREVWQWTIGLTIFFVAGQILLMPTASWLISIIPIKLPDSLPPAIDPRVVKSSLPTELWGIPLLGNWQIAILYLILLIFNIVSEEFWWRGYILPRQELRHGK
jgi:membrane protease YdiL (CAAX protease family)